MSGFDSSAPASAATPAEAISFAVHSLPSPELPEARRTRLGRLKMLLVLAICAAPVAASYFTFFVIRPQGHANYATLVEPRPIPATLALVDLQGRPVAPDSLAGQWLLVVASGPQCEAACEKALLMQRQLRESLGRDKARVDKVWFVTESEAPRAPLLEALRQGDPVTVLRVPRAQLAGWLVPEPGQALESHLYLVDPLGRFMLRAPADPDPLKLKRDLERLLRASAAWDEPGRPAAPRP